MPEIALARQTDRTLPVPLADTTVRPVHVVQILRRSAPLIVLFGLLFGITAYLATFYFLPKRYTATSMVAVQTQSFAIPELEGAMKRESLADPMPVVRSEVQILQSPALAKAVAADLNLAANPEFNPSLRPPTQMAEAMTWLQGVLPEWARERAETAGFFAKPQPISPDYLQDIMVGTLLRDLSIINDGRSLVIAVQFTAEDPELAASIVNTLIKRYGETKAEARDKTNREANASLNQRVKDVRGEVDALEQRIQQTREKYNIVQTRAGSVGQQQLEDLSGAVTKASADRAQLEANYQRAAAVARVGGISQDGADLLGSNTISGLRDREAEASRRVAQLSTTLGPGHPARRAAEAELASAQGAVAGEARRLVGALGAQVQAAKQREANLQQQLAQAQSKASGTATVQAELTQLEKDADARRLLYQNLIQRAEQTDKQGPEQTYTTVVSKAEAPTTPSSPRPKLAAALGMVGGFAFGGFLGMLRKRGSEAFSAPDEIADETGLAALATVPRMTGRAKARGLPAAVLAAPAGPEAEAVRLLRTRLRFVGRGAVPRSLLFVSSTAGEGASSLAAAFARLAALDGLRVLLIEGDLQGPSLARMLDLPPSNGIVETLVGHEHWRDAIVRDPHSNLECLVAGGSTAGAGQLLETMQLQNLIAEARDDYNLIVMDSQPLSGATHSLILAHVADAVVLVVAPEEASRQEVHAATEALVRAARKPPVIAVNKAAS